MRAFLERYLKIYGHEVASFTWSALFFFSVFFVLALFRNHVDALFLKRCGPHQIVSMLFWNGVLSILFFSLCRRLGRSISDRALLASCLGGYAFLQVALWFVAQVESPASYRVLFQMVYLEDAFLLVYLWNIVQELFDVRQGKRIFRLLMGAQVVGSTLGSLLSKPLADLVGPPPPLLVCAAGNAILSVMLRRSGASRPSGSRAPSGPTAAIPWADLLRSLSRYPILRFLCVSAIIPSILLPILTYQFSVIVDAAFSTEKSLLAFLSLFRSGMMIVIFGFILSMGEVYARLPVGVAVVIPCLNQCLVFGGLVSSFHVVLACYGQFSTIFLQRAILGPVNKLLYALLPKEISSWAQIFARGILCQSGMLLGALGMIALRPVLTARELGLVALFLAILWTIEAFRFRRDYRTGLRQVLLDESLDFDRFGDAAAGISHDPHPAQSTLAPEEYPEELFSLLEKLDIPEIEPDTALRQLEDPVPGQRVAAALSFGLTRDPRAVNRLIALLDQNEEVSRAAVDSLSRYDSSVLPLLEHSLLQSPLRVKRGILEIMRLARYPQLDLLPFIESRLLDAYVALIALKTLSGTNQGPGRCASLLTTHLQERHREEVGLVFQSLWVTSADMRLLLEGVSSAEASAVAEMLEVVLDKRLARPIVPLVDSIPIEEKIRRARELLPLPRWETPERVLIGLCFGDDPTTRLLALCVAVENPPGEAFHPVAERLAFAPDRDVREAAADWFRRSRGQEVAVPHVIQLVDSLRRFALFAGVGIRELRAVSSITELVVHPAGEIVVHRGDPFPTVRLVVQGKLGAFCEVSDAKPVAIVEEGGVLGELSLFTEESAAYTYVALEQSQTLVIQRHHFIEIMKIYPLIGINLCRYLASRLTGVPVR